MSQEEHRRRMEMAQYQPRRNPPLQPPSHHLSQQQGQFWQAHAVRQGPRHFYPMRQMFMQQGPFGNGGNQFLPPRFPRFPQPGGFQLRLQPPGYNNERRRNGGHHQFEPEYRHDNMNNHAHGGDFGHGARPKTTYGRLQREKRGKKKVRHRHSPNQTPGAAESSSYNNKNTEDSGKLSPLRTPSEHSDADVEQSHAQNGLSTAVVCDDPPVKTVPASSETADNQSTPGDEEGAVGGVNATDRDSPLCDKNLIDEGAICDLDTMFHRQEISRLDGGLNGLTFSDEEEDNGGLGSTVLLPDIDNVKDDSSSRGEVSSLSVVVPNHMLSSPALQSSNQLASPCPYTVNGILRHTEDDVEDTGDFIDTDLPAHCLLSSSDEMDNGSSSDNEEQEAFMSHKDDITSKHPLPDINCNILPCLQDNATFDSAGSRDVHPPEDSSPCSSPKQSVSPAHFNDTSSDSFDTQRRRRPTPSYASTDSDEDMYSSRPKGRPRHKASCGDGGAASQAVLDEQRFPFVMSTPLPGADSEAHLVSPASAAVLSSHDNQGSSAVTVSAEATAADTCCTSASGGACCPSSPQSPGTGNSPASYGAGMSAGKDMLCCAESSSASSCNTQSVSAVTGLPYLQDKTSDSCGPEDPTFSHDSGDNIDMVLLPMEEEIEPVLRNMYTSGVGGAGIFEAGLDPSSLAAQGSQPGNPQFLCDEHEGRCPLEQGHLRGAVPSKEFYELIKTVSTADSYMRFYDKDGHDVQREPSSGSDDDQTRDDCNRTDRLRVDRVMIWNEYEAYVMQFKQIAVSACGQTAVLNVLKALKIPCEKSTVCKVIQGSLRKEDAGIPEYLFSRAVAGTTAEELMSGIETLSGGIVGGRFFPFWPPRKIKLLQWLAYWMKRGAIPMATLNLQQGPHSLWQVPDSWHHQMVYGISHQGLYLTNPLEIVSERSAMKQLCSDSVLMVRRQDIISRYRKTTDLGELLNHTDSRWSTMNVLGQVINVLREYNMPSVPGYRLQVTSHISIPASYKAGITLFMRKDKAAWASLLNAPDLPLEDVVSPDCGGQQQGAVGGMQSS